MILTWTAHYLVGWDPRARDDVAFMADNCGHDAFIRDRIKGDRLVLTTPGNDPIVFHITRDLPVPEAPVWVDEVSINGCPWQVIERNTLTPRP